MILAGHRFRSGAILGLQQSSVHLDLQLEPPSGTDIVLLEERMRGYLEEDFPAAEARAGQDMCVALARRFAQWAIALQRRARLAVSQRFHVTDNGAKHGAISLALPCTRPELAIASLTWVLGEWRTNTLGGQGQAAFDALMTALRAGARRGLNAVLIADAAYALEMPVQQPLPGALLVGSGAHARWFNSTLTDRTPALGVRIARDKVSTATLLRRAGLPGAVHVQAATREEALASASRLGYPVVVKPADRDQGEGVSANLRNPADVATGYDEARGFSDRVLVERHCQGFTHRLTVFDGQLVKVAKRVAGGVFGDGTHTIAELVQLAAQDPERRRRAMRTGRPPLTLDAESLSLLTQAGIDPQTVPAHGTYVRLRRRDNINAGGSNVSVALDAVHPDNRALALRAAALLHLDFAGIDLIIEDIGVSWLECESLICEVNAQPQMGTSDTPTIYQDLLRQAVPNGGRIPISLVIPVSGAGVPLNTLIPRIGTRLQGHVLACRSGLFVDGKRVSRPFRSGYHAAAAALILTDTRAVGIAMTAEEIIERGLPVDRVDRVALVELDDATEAARATARDALALIEANVGTEERW